LAGRLSSRRIGHPSFFDGGYRPGEKVIFGCHWLCQCLDMLENSALAKPVALFFNGLLRSGDFCRKRGIAQARGVCKCRGDAALSKKCLETVPVRGMIDRAVRTTHGRAG
jgi:hypothetical protein